MAEGGGGAAQGGGGAGQGGTGQGGAGQGGAGQGGMGQGGMGQGGMGQGGAGQGLGETCGDALVVTEGEYTGTYSGFANDYDPTATGCTGYAAVGADIAYQITIPPGEELQAVVFPDTADASLYIVTDCSNLTTCVAGADDAGGGQGEGAFYTNSTNAPMTVYVIVDAFGMASGAYTLFLNTGTETTCNDWFDNDVDNELDCGDATTCGGTAACTPGASLTGAACTVNTNCAAVGGDPACITQTLFGYPGGYCSEWCNLMTDDCAGDATCLDVGLGNDGLCFDGCTLDTDCRTGYYCDTVCLPTPAACMAPPTAVLGNNTGDTTGAANEMASNCVSSTDGAERVYTFVPATSGNMTLTLTSASDQGISVRSPSCAALGSELDCTDAFAGGTNEVLTQPVTAGTTYYILVEAYGAGDEGPYTLNIAIN